MKIEIVSRWNSSKILLCGEYESVKDCLEKNIGADLGGADLRGAYLGGADLGGADLRGAYLGGADLGGADLGGADLGGADLRGAYLGGADLRGAYLGGAYLGGADLGGAKQYYISHDFCLELIRRQDIKFFSDREWITIGKIATHRICWEEIIKNYKFALPIFKKLAKKGFNEYLKKFKGEI